MKKHKNKIITAAIVLAVLVAAFLYGGNYSKRDYLDSSAMTEQTGGQPLIEEQTTPLSGSEGISEASLTEENLTNVEAAKPDDPAGGTLSESTELTTTSEPSTESSPGMELNPETGKDRYQTEPVPKGKPMPVEPQAVAVGDGSFTVTLSVRCDTILDNMNLLNQEKRELIPRDGVIFPATAVTVYEGESVFNILQREMRRAKIHMEFRNTPIYNSAYIMAINNLYEFDVGELSGWMYKVNGWYPNYGCSRYQLRPGDVIQWHYTCDLGRDLGEFWLGAGGQIDD